MRENYLYLYAFCLEENKWPEMPLQAIYMPREWGQCILEYTNDFDKPVKITDLNRKLRCLFPEVMGSYAGDEVLRGEKPWLIVTPEVNVSQVSMITLNWLKANWRHGIFPGMERLEGTSLLQQSYHLQENWWEDNIVTFDVIPGIFARCFCRKLHTLEFDGEAVKLNFVHVFFNNVHECMSLPVRKKGTTRSGHFSYVLRVSVITRGGDTDRHLLKVSIGIRRYQESPVIFSSRRGKIDCRLYSRVKSSMLVSIPNPLENAEGRVLGYSQLQFRRVWNKENFTQWHASDYLFWDVLMGESLNPDDVLKDPERFFLGDKGVKALIVHSNQAYGQRGVTVQPGIGLPERCRLFELFKKECGLQHQLPLLPEINNKMKRNRLPVKVAGEMEVTLELWVTQKMYERVIEVLTAPMSKPEEQPILLKSPGKNRYILNADKRVVIHLVQLDPRWLIKELETGELGQEKAFKKRVNEIRAGMRRVAENIMALIEIDEKEKYGDDKDPKLAVRNGMAATGRVTQFIHPLDVGDKPGVKDRPDSRIKNSFLDLLADFGFFSAAMDEIPSTGHIVAVDILKRWNSKKRASEFLPVLSWYDGKQLVFKKLGDSRWLSVRDGLLQMNENYVTLDNGDSKRFQSFLKQELEELLMKTTGTVYLMVKASLRCRWWNNLSNPKINSERLPFFDEELPDMYRLRVVRINTTSDVPQYDIVDDIEDLGINKKRGLFKDKKGIYYSVGVRPSAWQVRKDATKYNMPNKMLMKQNAVEIIPLGCKDENERDNIAAMIDKLRRTNITYDASTVLPFPMHQLKSLAKYWIVEEDFAETVQGFEEDVLLEEDR